VKNTVNIIATALLLTLLAGAGIASAAISHNGPTQGHKVHKVFIPKCLEDQAITRAGKCVTMDDADFRDGYWYADKNGGKR
jgi:hypothetical protein